MSITKKTVGKVDNKDAILYTLSNNSGLTAEIYNYGGIIKSLKINGRDVVLGRDNFEDYLNNDGYLGAAVGRVANRINRSCFILNGREYKVTPTNDVCTLHGGARGFNAYIWDAEISDGSEPALILRHVSPDGDEGFPGKLEVKMTYTLTASNSLKIDYDAVCDSDTMFNPTNHSYFNLDGHNSGTIYTQTLRLNCDFYTPNNNDLIPTGEVLKVEGTPFDYTTAAVIGDKIHNAHPQAEVAGGGIDHNFAIRGYGFRKACELVSSDKSITMETYTDMPGLQVYTANMLDTGCYKEGAAYGKHTAICFETQFFPNSTEHSHFIAPVMKKDEPFHSSTEYKFTVK